MCAEQDPIVCHRAILICPHLESAGLEVYHFRKNDNLEVDQDLANRVLKQHNLYRISTKNKSHVKQLSLLDKQSTQTMGK
ncbi:DUF488 domain-containing protein [Trichormus azollae]|jgi:hypothetical protein|uniref:DUF488 domain-containing protein n=1 Tax=Trichormus azollae TaxID=1164 RepID=UPI0001958551|nr:DUF488 domain-containing protein [Trichormus azollae]